MITAVRTAQVPVAPSLRCQPNPATAWTEESYVLIDAPAQATMHLHDLAGREVARQQLLQTEGNVLLDTRRLQPGPVR